MSAAAEETREEVKRVMPASARAAAGFVLRKTFVAVLVVDLTGFGLGESFVGFGYLDKFLGCDVIASKSVGESARML